MKRLALTVLSIFALICADAQKLPATSTRTTAYEEFVPAKVTLSSGKTITQQWANVFLKNSSLVYKRGRLTMEASPEQISRVSIGGDEYVRIDTALARVVDTLRNSRLLCVTTIDVAAYRSQLVNNRQMNDFEIGAHVNYSSTDLAADDERTYPLLHTFYFDLGGEIVRVHERTLQRKFTKDKRRTFKTIIESPDFSWDDPASLMLLLKEIDGQN